MAKRNNNIIEYLKLKCAFVGIPDDTIKSPELNALSVQARWLYIVLLTEFDRKKINIKNYFPFLYKDLQEITGFDRRRIAVCIRELEGGDFIDVVHGGKNNPSEYRPNIRWLV